MHHTQTLVDYGQKMIGIKFYPDKVVQAIVKQLPDHKWSDTYHMVVIPNNKKNLTTIFKAFKGVAWVNTSHFLANRPVNKGKDDISVDQLRKWTTKKDWKYCPEEFYQKLEILKYSLNTARIYITMFERFINYYKNEDNLMNLNEQNIKKFLQLLVQEKR